VWINFHGTAVSEESKTTWYRVIHDILLTKKRLKKIRLFPTDSCGDCGKTVTIKHRIIGCGEGGKMWTWTKTQIAWMLRTEPDNIPGSWVTCPQFNFWPPNRHRAIL
jgi:hypothetical protein